MLTPAHDSTSRVKGLSRHEERKKKNWKGKGDQTSWRRIVAVRATATYHGNTGGQGEAAKHTVVRNQKHENHGVAPPVTHLPQCARYIFSHRRIQVPMGVC